MSRPAVAALRQPVFSFWKPLTWPPWPPEPTPEQLIQYVASSEEDLFRQMQDKDFKRFNGETTALHLTGRPVTPFDMTLKEHILAYLMDPNIAFILLAVGALALYTEFNHPGAVI